MGKFNLEEISSVMEGAVILGVDKNRFSFLANKFLRDNNQWSFFVDNKNIAKLVLDNVYGKDGTPLRSFRSKRDFRIEDYDTWRRYAESNEIEIPEFNFPCAMREEFIPLTRILEKLQLGKGAKIRERFGTELEMRIYLPAQFRYCCKKSSFYFYEEDAMRVAQEVLSKNGNEYLTDGHIKYTFGEVAKMIMHPTIGEETSRSRIPNLIKTLGDEGIEIEVDIYSKPRLILLDDQKIEALKEANKDFKTKKRKWNTL